jgi:hypothetical protein
LLLPPRETRLAKMLSGHHVTIKRVALRVNDGGVGCDSLRGIGFRFVCSCGTEGRIRGNRYAAVSDGQGHRALKGT